MRDAIGGTWLMYLVLIFIVLFSGFLAFAINYSKAFRVKNEVINIIERNEGYVDDEVSSYLDKIGYNMNPETGVVCPKSVYEGDEKNSENGLESSNTYMKKHNLCIKRYSFRKNDSDTTYYRVTSFVIVELPVVWQNFALPVSGETKRIYN